MKAASSIALECRLGNGNGYGGLIDITQQEFGEGIAGALYRLPVHDLCGRVGRKGVIAARILIADLVEILAIVFEAEFEAVLALVPGEVVDELSGVVFVLVRAIGIIAEAAETISTEAHGRDAPGDGQASPPDWEGSMQRRRQ